MRGTLTKLLIVATLLVSMVLPRAAGQCELIIEKHSGQAAGSVCAPVILNMDVKYKFMLPVDPSRVQILYVWNDGTGATSLVPSTSHGDTVFTATATHVYPPANDNCSYTAEAYVVFNGQQCVSSGRQEQTFSAWARDDQNGAVVITDPVVAEFCEGEEIIDVRFRDNSTFNCNINIEPDKPNQLTRWVQFIYGTTTVGGDRIPNVTIRDPLGNIYQMTDATGNSLPPVAGPIVEIPIPADGPTEISWPISAPAGAVAGDIFEITLRNWNICNPYDNNPFDAIPPGNPVDGDNPPVTTTALIEIIAIPPVIPDPAPEFCAGSPINLELSTSGGQVRWYTDSLLTNHIHTGRRFNPAGPPTYIDNSRGGSYTFWVTETRGNCTSVPGRVSFTIYDRPVPAPDAGDDRVICGDSFVLEGNTPVIGTGIWSTTSPAHIVDPSDPHSAVTGLATGPNIFRWTVTNGVCVLVDEVVITGDLQPDPAIAGDDMSFCNTTSTGLYANSPTNGGTGTWSVISGDVAFSDPNDPNATATSVAGGENILVWTIRSRFEACPATSDTLAIDFGVANAEAGVYGPVCDTQVTLNGNRPGPGTTGTWTKISGSGTVAFIPGPHSPSAVVQIEAGDEGYYEFEWRITGGSCPPTADTTGILFKPAIGIPSAADSERCGQGTLTLTSSPVAGSEINRWYDSPSAGTLLFEGYDFTTPYLTGNTSYWVSGYNSTTGCESVRQRVNAIINPIPGFPTAPDVERCGPGTVILTAVPGTNGTTARWYDSLTGGSMLAQENAYSAGSLSATGRFYVSTYNEITQCESSRREVIAFIHPVPAPISIIGPETVGVGQTNVIYSVNYQPGSTYQWTIPPGIDPLQVSQNFVLLGFPVLGLYNITVVETNSPGCPGPPATKPVEVREDMIVLAINPSPGEGCANTPLQLTVNPTGGTPSYSFSWTGDTRFLSSDIISNPVFTSPVPGSYLLMITVTDINMNEATDTITITIYPNPDVTIAGDTVVCAGSDLPLNAVVSGGSGVYGNFMWSGRTVPLSETNIPNPVFNTYVPGTYTLLFTAEDDRHCRVTDSVTILNDLPRAAFTSGVQLGCSPVNISFVNTSVDAASYLWDFDDGSHSEEAEPVHVFNNTSTSVQYFNVRLMAISANNCTHTSNGYVTVYPNPGLEISIYPEKACAPADILLSSTPGGVNYHWEFGDGNSSAGNFNIMHTFENHTDRDTTFLARLISTSFFGCEDTSYTTIIVHPSPEASFTVDPVTQMIPDRTVNLVNTTEDGEWNYTWRFGDKTTSTLRDPGSHTYPGPGNYLIYLVVKSIHCADSVWASAEIVPHPPVAAFKPVEPGCMPLTIQFENTSAYSNSFLWEFGDGAVSNKPNPEYTYYEPGSYTIRLTAWGDDGRADSYSTENDVYVLPNAFFDIKPRRVYVNDQEVLFDNLTDNGGSPVDGNTYLWDFGDGTGSDEKSPRHMYKKAGDYNVTLNVWTNKGCYDVYEYKTAVLVAPVGKVVFPNVFSPEATLEENRIFKPAIIDFVNDYHLMIFNRWGELIYESFSLDVGWDGKINGKTAKEDVYIWKVEGTYTNGQTFVQYGDVTLLH